MDIVDARCNHEVFFQVTLLTSIIALPFNHYTALQMLKIEHKYGSCSLSLPRCSSLHFPKPYFAFVSRDSSVDIATRYGLDSPGIESLWGVRFSAPVHTGPGTHPTTYKIGNGSLPGVKRPECGVDPSSTSSTEIKETVDVYLYSPSVLSWPVLG